MLQVPVLIHSRQREKQKQLKFVKSTDVVKQLDITKDFLGCLVSSYSTINGIHHTNLQVLLNRKEPSAQHYDIGGIQSLTSVVQVVRKTMQLPTTYDRCTGLAVHSV